MESTRTYCIFSEYCTLQITYGVSEEEFLLLRKVVQKIQRLETTVGAEVIGSP